MEIMEDTNSNSQVRISGSFDSPYDSLLFLYVFMCGMLLRSVTGLKWHKKPNIQFFTNKKQK